MNTRRSSVTVVCIGFIILGIVGCSANTVITDNANSSNTSNKIEKGNTSSKPKHSVNKISQEWYSMNSTEKMKAVVKQFNSIKYRGSITVSQCVKSLNLNIQNISIGDNTLNSVIDDELGWMIWTNEQNKLDAMSDSEEIKELKKFIASSDFEGLKDVKDTSDISIIEEELQRLQNPRSQSIQKPAQSQSNSSSNSNTSAGQPLNLSANGFTLANFDKINSNFTLADVNQLFGSFGTLSSESGQGTGYDLTTYTWQAPNSNAIITIMFQNGYETAKDQVGLN